MNCTHATATAIRTTCYLYPVSRNENPAAHGNITDCEECASCGARRSVNINGNQREEGPWGPSRADREQAARRAEDLARALVARMPVAKTGGWTATVDPDGFVRVDGPEHTDAEGQAVYATLPQAWRNQAADCRRAVLAAEAARAHV